MCISEAFARTDAHPQRCRGPEASGPCHRTPYRRATGLECGGKRSATPLWMMSRTEKQRRVRSANDQDPVLPDKTEPFLLDTIPNLQGSLKKKCPAQGPMKRGIKLHAKRLHERSAALLLLACPLGVECPRLVDSFIRMRAEIIPLCLNEIGRQSIAPIRIEVTQR